MGNNTNFRSLINNIFEEGELTPEATIKKFLTVRQEGHREVRRELDFYNLDMIISVRNHKRFPADFMFPLSRDEIRNISQIVISSKIKHSRNVFAFTEQGVAMLSSILNSDRAIEVNIAIMRVFVKLREMIASHKDLSRKLDALEKKYDENFKVVFEAIRALMAPPERPRKKIGFALKEPRASYRKKGAKKPA